MSRLSCLAILCGAPRDEAALMPIVVSYHILAASLASLLTSHHEASPALLLFSEHSFIMVLSPWRIVFSDLMFAWQVLDGDEQRCLQILSR